MQAQPDGQWGIGVMIRVPVLDARGSGGMLPVCTIVQVPRFITESRHGDAFADWLQGQLFQLEIHESREWLRRDGAIYDDPHKRSTSKMLKDVKL
jgi:hypothetical protein